MENIQWKVGGMTCANCALTIRKYLENKGQSNIKVNPIDGDVHFDTKGDISLDQLAKGIEDLGYSVVKDEFILSAAC